MVRKIACLLLLASLAAFRASGAEPKPAEIGELVARLGADDYATREEATRRLRGLGAAARGPLEKAAGSSDPEVAERAAVLLREIVWKLPDDLARRLGDFSARFAGYLKAPKEEKLSLLRELRRLAPVEAEPFLLQAAKELTDSGSRGWLADLLAIYRSPEAEKTLTTFAGDEDRFCRGAAARALGHSPGENALQVLIKLAGDGDAPVRSAAFGALARRGPFAAGALTAVEAGLSDADETVRRAAAEAAGRLGSKRTVKKLWELAGGEELAVRVEALAALGRLADADDRAQAARLAGLLNDDMPAVRATAIQALVVMNGRSQAPALAALLKDGDPDIAAEAAQALGALGGEEERKKLRKMLRSAGTDSLRASAGRALVMLGDAEAPKEVVRLMFGKNATTASVCAETLGMTGNPKWSAELARAEKHWKSASFRTRSLEVRARSFGDAAAVGLLAREISGHGSEMEWAFFLADRCLFEEAVSIMRSRAEKTKDDPDMLGRLGMLEIQAGRAGEGVARLRLAARMDPFDPVNGNNCAWFLVTAADEKARNYAEGLRLAERAARLRPRTGYILDTYAWALHRNGRSAEALKEIEKALEWARADSPGEVSVLRAHRARILAATGKRREALAEMAELLKRWPRDPELALEAARAYCDLAAADRAIAQLARAVELGHPNVHVIESDPELAAARRDPGFAQVLAKARKALEAFRTEYSKAGPGSERDDGNQVELEL
jgi:HEAT repeat protein